MPRCIVLHPTDNVATLIDAARAGDECTLQGDAAGSVRARQDVPFGHKLCIEGIPAGAPVLKYGEVIGVATCAIARGEHAHVHNFDSARARGDLHREEVPL